MKEILLVALGFMFFGCDSANNQNADTNADNNTEAGTDNTTSDNPGDVDKGSGNEISPQLDGVEDSAARLEVNDPLNTTQESEERSN